MMESIETLRSCGVRSNQIGMRFVDENELQRIADEIEAEWQDSYDAMCLEIERGYMKLPVDADGVPIHIGDKIRWADKGPFEVCGVNEDYAWFYGSDKAASANVCHHAKPRTLEDVLDDYAKDVYKHGRDVNDVEKYAAEIRELMGGDER